MKIVDINVKYISLIVVFRIFYVVDIWCYGNCCSSIIYI